jgi:hypothetical protein
MRARYCKCKNTYTINECKKRYCKVSEYWKQGIGSIHINNHSSSIVNEDTENVLTHTSSDKGISQEDTVINIDTTRTIND